MLFINRSEFIQNIHGVQRRVSIERLTNDRRVQNVQRDRSARDGARRERRHGG